MLTKLILVSYRSCRDEIQKQEEKKEKKQGLKRTPKLGNKEDVRLNLMLHVVLLVMNRMEIFSIFVIMVTIAYFLKNLTIQTIQILFGVDKLKFLCD